MSASSFFAPNHDLKLANIVPARRTRCQIAFALATSHPMAPTRRRLTMVSVSFSGESNRAPAGGGFGLARAAANRDWTPAGLSAAT